MGAEAEIDARILGGHVAHAAFGLIVACEITGGDFQAGAGAVAIAFYADKADAEPMIFAGGGRSGAVVAEKLRVLTVVIHQET